MRMNEWQETSMDFAKPSAEHWSSPPLEIVRGSPGDRVHHDIEPPPQGLDASEHCGQLARLGHVEGFEDRSVQRLGQRLDVGPRLVVEIGEWVGVESR